MDFLKAKYFFTLFLIITACKDSSVNEPAGVNPPDTENNLIN